MPTIGSETYRSSVPPDSPTKETRLSESHEHSSAIKGEDWNLVAPTIEGLNPDSASVPGPDFYLEVNGAGFQMFSIINWNGGDEPTEFVNPGKLRTLVKPSTIEAELPFSLPVYVRNGDLKSNVAQFTFEAGAKSR